jgi:TetR/AcrR family transcriptional regulator
MQAPATSLAPPTATASVDPEDRRGRKGRATAERILDVAEEVFAERGFEGATLRDVASAVGIRTPSLYNYFESKDALYAAVLERGIGPLLEALLESARVGSPGGDPEKVVAQMVALLAKRPNLPRLVLHETLYGGRHLTRMLQQWIGPLLERAQEMVEEGPGASRWEPEQLPILVLAMYHIVVGYFAIAPFYKDLNGVDLLADEALARQTRFLARLASSLFGDAASTP